MIPRYSRAEMSGLWSDENRFKIWLEVEIAAMAAMVEAGIVPADALKGVQERAAFNCERVLELEKTLKHDVIAFLTNVAEYVGDEARYLHYGMTSSDLLDTTFALQLKRAGGLLLEGLDTLLDSIKKRAFEFKLTPCMGRSHGIHAEPTSFGLKLATFYAELLRQKNRLVSAIDEISVGAFSGPVGTLAHLSPAIEEGTCKQLGLKTTPISTQVISRDLHANYFLVCAQIAASLERLAIEVRHLQRTEVREAEENFTVGQKGSSAMPHKRNPILTENISGLGRLIRSMAVGSLENLQLWHERDISHSSMERVIGPDITITLDFILHRMNSVVSELKVYPEQMMRNLNLTGGLHASGSVLVLLASKGLAREEAYIVVQRNALAVWDELSTTGRITKTLKQRLLEESEIKNRVTAEELEGCFSVEKHLAHVDHIFKRVFGK